MLQQSFVSILFACPPFQVTFDPHQTRIKFSSPKPPLIPSGTAPKILSTEGFQLLGAEQRGTIPGQPLVWQLLLSRDFLSHSRGFPAGIILPVTRVSPRRCSGCVEGQGHPQEQQNLVSLQRMISSNIKMNFLIRKKRGIFQK